MKISLICTGTELLNGKLNTNAAYIGSKLSQIGLELYSVIDISDRKEDLLTTLQTTIRHSDIIITTGGLGPTFDDITVETVAQCLGLNLYCDKEVLNTIESYFKKRGYEYMPEVNKRQANIIKGAKVLINRFGTAPGQMLNFKDNQNTKTFFLLPGPPREMQPLFEENIIPFLKNSLKKIKKNEVIHVFGLAESVVDEKIQSVIKNVSFENGNTAEFGILASDAVIDVELSVSGKDEISVDETLSKLKSQFQDILKDNIFGYGKETLEEVISKLFISAGKTLSTAESCTGGLVSKKITDIAGCSSFYKGSIIAYSNDVKKSFLEVKNETLENFGAVSKETAYEMACGIRKALQTDFSISITGIAGPTGATNEKPVGLVYIGVSSKDSTEVYKKVFTGTRQDIRLRTTNSALDLLRRKIIKETKQC